MIAAFPQVRPWRHLPVVHHKIVILETVRSWIKRGESGGGGLREPALLGEAGERGKKIKSTDMVKAIFCVIVLNFSSRSVFMIIFGHH